MRPSPPFTLRHAITTALVAITVAPAAARADFYTPPSPLPAGKPGDVIRSEPTTLYELPGVQLPARAWRIMYLSTTAQGQPTAVTGVVLVPTRAWAGKGERPLVGYSIGTQGLADRCAPSKRLAAGTVLEGSVINEALAKGWALALTDYPGLGTPGDHTYVMGRALGPAVLDSMRAALRLPADGLSPRAPLALYGYSEGGGGAAAAAEQQPAYAPDLPLVGVAAGGVPADMLREAAWLEGTPFFWLQAYALLGVNVTYPEVHVDRYLNARGRQLFARMDDTCVEDAAVEGAALSATGNHITDYTTTNPFKVPAIAARVRENRLGSMAPQAPVIQGHAPLDEAVQYAQDVTLYHDWCSLGVNDHFVNLPLEHLAAGMAFAGPAMDFLARRFAGVPAPRAMDCIATAVARSCSSRRVITIRLPRSMRSARVTYAGRSAKVTRRGGRVRARVDLRKLPAGRVVVRVRGRDARGRVVRQTRVFRLCARRQG